MGKSVLYYCDCCGKEINGARYRAVVTSCSCDCNKKLSSKTFVLCENCFSKTFKKAEGDEQK